VLRHVWRLGIATADKIRGELSRPLKESTVRTVLPLLIQHDVTELCGSPRISPGGAPTNLSISQILQKSPDDRLFVHEGTSFQHGIGEVFIPARSVEAVSRQPQHGFGLS
jgi:hypothetical protein